MKRITFIIFVWLLALIPRVIINKHKFIFSHDEIIAMVEAAGNMGYYKNVESVEGWSGWERANLRKGEAFSVKPLDFKTIRDDMAKYDIHPPLYFWILNIFLSLFGFNVWSPFILNSLLILLQAIIIVKILEVVGGRIETPDVILLSGIFFLLPGDIAMSLEARQYELLNTNILINPLFILEGLEKF